MSAHATLPPVTPGAHPRDAESPLAPLDHVRMQVAAALFGDAPPTPAIGRFLLQRMIGAGGMGIVYAATDPQLGRTVALKLIQPTSAGERATERLLREAQAMARLQHPNVVAVHEAGVHGGQVYLAMEYVDGGTLAAWLRAQPRPWQEILGVLTQAGEGLAAAHEAGLVHRDFKPQNVLMSGARARISDFGLARSAAVAEELERTAGDAALRLDQPLTRTDALLGTPAYMAPEQLRGATATPASDQFSFAVVVYEALAGHRPFRGDTIGALLAAIERGELHPIQRDIPAGVLTVLRRALAVDPARRWPDMPTLLAALRDVRGGARPWVLASTALGLSALVGLGALLVRPPPDQAPPAPAILPGCGDSDPLGDLWDDARRARVVQVLSSGTEQFFAPDLAARIAPIDAYAAALRDAHRRRCDAPPPADAWTERCLADRRAAFVDFTEALLDAPPALRITAGETARELLPDLSACAEPVRYRALVSDISPQARAEAWWLRLANVSAFGPRPTTHFVAAFPPDEEASRRFITFTPAADNPRAVHEASFALIIGGLHGPHVLAHDTLRDAVELGRRASRSGHADLAARAWVLAAELIEAGPHADEARQEAWSAAATALDALPPRHPLHLRLRRDLAYVELVHARHAAPAGECSEPAPDAAACHPLATAITHLTAVAADPSATAADLELLARAHDHAGDAAAAAAARARATPIDLDERSLGFLDFPAPAAAHGVRP